MHDYDDNYTDNAENYWVWALGRDNKPLTTEGPWGPYDYQTARTYARISATEGTHNRAVSRGQDPLASTFEIMRMYRAGTGEHIYGVAQRIGAPLAANAGRLDEEAASELKLYIDNTAELMGPGSQGDAIRKNLRRKIAKGTFDLERSVDAWMYLVESGAKRYEREFGTPGTWHQMFSVPTRRAVARELAEDFQSESGEMTANTEMPFPDPVDDLERTENRLFVIRNELRHLGGWVAPGVQVPPENRTRVRKLRDEYDELISWRERLRHESFER
jgi:hypothetical protein